MLQLSLRLLPGAYTVTAQHDGFQAVTVSPIFVKFGSVPDTATLIAHAAPVQMAALSPGNPRRMPFASRFDF